MGCGGCGKKTAAIKGGSPPAAPRFIHPPPPPPRPAPATRSLAQPPVAPRAPHPAPAVQNQSNITIKSESRVCRKCGQRATFQIVWSERLRRYFEVSKCPCENP